jgi:type II secretory pathway component PulM
VTRVPAGLDAVRTAWTRLAPRDRRALRLGGAVVAAVGLYTLVLAPYGRALAEARSRLTAQRELLARESALLAAAARFPAARAGLRVRLRSQTPRLFEAPDSLTAAAALAQYVAERAEDAGVVVDERDTRVGDPAGEGLATLEATVRGRGDLEGVLLFLRELEHGPKLVRVVRLDIEPEIAPGSEAVTAGAPVPDDAAETLRVAMVVQGFAVARAGAPDAPRTGAAPSVVATVPARGPRE